MNKTLEFIAELDRKFSALFTDEMHERICGHSQQIYVVMREVCPILDMLLVEGNYHEELTIGVREKLARLLRMIDGSEEYHNEQ